MMTRLLPRVTSVLRGCDHRRAAIAPAIAVTSIDGRSVRLSSCTPTATQQSFSVPHQSFRRDLRSPSTPLAVLKQRTQASPLLSLSSTAHRSLSIMASSDQTSNNQDFLLANVFSVKDKVALITGGGSGIGLMAAQALAANGAKVYIVGRTREKLEQVVKMYSAGKADAAGEIIPLTADVSDKESIKKLYEEVEGKEKGGLDILINNAGISTETFETEASTAEAMKKQLFDDEAATFADWDAVYRTNVSQCYFMTTAFLPLLQRASERQHGWSSTVINISSISGRVKTMQHHPQYNASKAATIHLTRMLAHEVANNDLRIRINSIAPGVFPSEMTTGGESDDTTRKSHIPKEKYAEKVPASRAGKDRDMAGAVLFAATNQYFNGQTVVVDGGYELAAGL